MKYGSVGFVDCESEAVVVLSLKSGLERLKARLFVELPTYKCPNQRDSPGKTHVKRPNVENCHKCQIV